MGIGAQTKVCVSLNALKKTRQRVCLPDSFAEWSNLDLLPNQEIFAYKITSARGVDPELQASETPD